MADVFFLWFGNREQAPTVWSPEPQPLPDHTGYLLAEMSARSALNEAMPEELRQEESGGMKGMWLSRGWTITVFTYSE